MINLANQHDSGEAPLRHFEKVKCFGEKCILGTTSSGHWGKSPYCQYAIHVLLYINDGELWPSEPRVGQNVQYSQFEVKSLTNFSSLLSWQCAKENFCLFASEQFSFVSNSTFIDNIKLPVDSSKHCR